MSLTLLSTYPHPPATSPHVLQALSPTPSVHTTGTRAHEHECSDPSPHRGRDPARGGGHAPAERPGTMHTWRCVQTCALAALLRETRRGWYLTVSPTRNIHPRTRGDKRTAILGTGFSNEDPFLSLYSPQASFGPFLSPRSTPNILITLSPYPDSALASPSPGRQPWAHACLSLRPLRLPCGGYRKSLAPSPRQ